MQAATVDLATLWRHVRASKKMFLYVVGCCGVAGVLLALLLPPRYTATVILSPAENDVPSGGLAALAGQFAGIADMAGIRLGGSVNSDEAVTILSSREFTERFIANNGLLPILFEEDWDAEGGTWKKGNGPGVMQSFSKWVARITGDRGVANSSSGNSADGSPTLWRAFKMFDSIRRIETDRKTRMVRVSIVWKDPQIAAKWANGLVEELNRHTRERAIREAERSQEFLKGEIDKTNVVPMQTTLYRLLESELKKAMIANVREEYAFRILDRAIPPMQRTSPKRAQIVLASGLLGVIIGVCVALMRGRRTATAG